MAFHGVPRCWRCNHCLPKAGTICPRCDSHAAVPSILTELEEFQQSRGRMPGAAWWKELAIHRLSFEYARPNIAFGQAIPFRDRGARIADVPMEMVGSVDDFSSGSDAKS